MGFQPDLAGLREVLQDSHSLFDTVKGTVNGEATLTIIR